MLSPRLSKGDNPFLSALASSRKHSLGSSDVTSQSIRTLPPASVEKQLSQSSNTIASGTTAPVEGFEEYGVLDPRRIAVPLPRSSNKSLHLKGVPDELNNEVILLDHFNKFGVVESVVCNIDKKCADLHFQTRVKF